MSYRQVPTDFFKHFTTSLTVKTNSLNTARYSRVIVGDTATRLIILGSCYQSGPDHLGNEYG